MKHVSLCYFLFMLEVYLISSYKLKQISNGNNVENNINIISDLIKNTDNESYNSLVSNIKNVDVKHLQEVRSKINKNIFKNSTEIIEGYNNKERELFMEEEKVKINIIENHSLAKVLREINFINCKDDLLCIELGRICGDWDLKPKKVDIDYFENREIDQITKAIVIVNNTQTIPKVEIPHVPTHSVYIDTDDCDNLNINALFLNSSNYNGKALDTIENQNNLPVVIATNFHFKEKQNSEVLIAESDYVKKNKTSIEKHIKSTKIVETFPNSEKFYRKVSCGKKKLTKDTFKQGINIIVLDRFNNSIVYIDKTFDIVNHPLHAEKLACLIKEQEKDKIIILTAIGSWFSGLTPRLIKEIKNIGGPNFNKIMFILKESKLIIEFALIGANGLCENNGQYYISSNSKFDLKMYLYPEMTLECQDIFIKIESCCLTPILSPLIFQKRVDIEASIKLQADNRFSGVFPYITSVTPIFQKFIDKQQISISYIIYGELNTLDTVILKDNKYKVSCGKIENLQDKTVTCLVDYSNLDIPIDYNFKGIAQVEILDRNTNYKFKSTQFRCPMFNFIKTAKEEDIIVKLPVPPKKQIFKDLLCCKTDMSCCPLVKPIYMKSEKRNWPIFNFYNKEVKP